MEKTFIIGDTHFGHKNIIKYENRQYVNVSVEVIGYKPIDFEEIKARFKEEE